jgi:predicted metal-binding membrane protein
VIARENFFILLALVLLSGLAWVVTVYEAGGMGWGMFTCSMTMGTPFSMSNGVLYVVLWGVMMVAMMLPAMTPIVGLFRTIAKRKREQGQSFTPAWVFIAGYVILWTLTGSLGYVADMAIQSYSFRHCDCTAW